MFVAYVLLAFLLILGFTGTILKLPTKKIVPWFHFSITRLSPKVEIVDGSGIGMNKMGRKPGDRSQLGMVFATFDKNKDGFITKIELKESFEKIGIGMSEGELEEIVDKSDANGDGLIEFDEFCDLFESVGGRGGDVEEEEEGLRDAFDVFDGDKDGMISVEELGFVLRSLGMREGKRVESCKEMIKKVDVDGDGMVSFDEFKIMMRSGGSLVQVA